jgi:hypothetical protein
LATVITNLLSAIPWIGTDLVTFIWGNFSVENPTLNRFFSLHFLLPFVLTALVLIHIMALHMYGSNNPLGYSSHTDRLAFHSFFTLKDLVGLVVWLIGLAVLVFFVPNMLGRLEYVKKELVAVLSLIAYHNQIAICWKPFQIYPTKHVSEVSISKYLPLLVKMGILKQSAGNCGIRSQISNIFDFAPFSTSSSETTRDLSLKKEVEPKAPSFYSWLGGLIDGDGCIGIMNKGKTPYCEITLASKDVKVLYFIKKFLGFGIVSKRSNVNAYRFRTYSISHVKQLLDKTSCYMISDSSIKRLEILDNFYLKSYITENTNKAGIIPPFHHFKLQKTELEKTLIIKSTSWLAVFFDAEGHFSILSNATLTINISQKEKNLLLLIKNSFSMGHVRYDKSWNGWSFMISKKEDIRFFLNSYFGIHKIKTLKAVDRKTFLRLLNYIDKNYHLVKATEVSGNKKFEKLKSKFKKRN